MSNNFFRILVNVFRGLSNNSNKSNHNLYDPVFNIGSILCIGSVHALYVYSTDNKEEVKISKKYKMYNNGSTQFMIVDNKGRHFNVNNSLWYWKWDSIEDWEKINKGDNLSIKYYGFRSPFFGLFPNIVRSVKV